MSDKKRIVAIIPARAGSKRISNKNIKPLADKPLIEWTIQAALSSTKIDHVVVSTDSEEIASVAKNAGADVPFLRPGRLGGDTSTTVDVILHALKALGEVGKTYEYVMVLQPTSPLRTASHIDGALMLAEEKNADGVISVCPCEHSPLWAGQLKEDQSMDGFIDLSITKTRSQDLPSYFRLNGGIYLVNTDRLLKEQSLFLADNAFAFVMDTIDSVDIDEELDFMLAETIVRSRLEQA